jgi:hypothetical protein
MDPLSIEGLAQEVYRGFLVPSVNATEWHDRYKWLNRAAGEISGMARVLDHFAATVPVFAQFPDGRAAIAQAIADRATNLVDLEEPGTEANRRKVVEGLTKRVAKCLLALEGTVIS